VLVRACILAALLPATDDATGDLALLEELLAMDERCLGSRQPKVTPAHIVAKLPDDSGSKESQSRRIRRSTFMLWSRSHGILLRQASDDLDHDFLVASSRILGFDLRSSLGEPPSSRVAPPPLLRASADYHHLCCLPGLASPAPVHRRGGDTAILTRGLLCPALNRPEHGAESPKHTRETGI
jgi:hypothetical protein